MKKINKKLLIVFICLVVFVIFLFILFYIYHPSNILSFDLHCLNDPIHVNDKSKFDKNLIKERNILFFMFISNSGSKKNDIILYVRTMDCKKYLYIDKFVFKIGNEESVVYYKKSFKLDEEPSCFEYEGKKYIKYMTTFSYPNTPRIKINKMNLFKKRELKDCRFTVKMIAYYSFDDEEIQSSEYLYEVYCSNGKGELHPWIQFVYGILGIYI